MKVIRNELQMTPEAVIIPVSASDRSGKYQVWDLINQIFEVNAFDIHLERQNTSE
jgi:GTP-binding protein